MACHSGYKKNNNSSLSDVELLECFTADYSDMVTLAKRIGPQAFNALLDTFGGTKPHVPTRDSFWGRLRLEVRDTEMRARFTGNNHQELADDYGLALNHVYRIVNHNTRH